MTPHSTSPVASRNDPVAPRPRTASLLTIEVLDTPDVLVRVLTTLRSRRCAITHVDYLAEDRHRPGHLVVGIEPPRARAHCVEAWLLNLVDVVAVHAAF